MSGKQLVKKRPSHSVRTLVRRTKAHIRRTVLDIEERNNQIRAFEAKVKGRK